MKKICSLFIFLFFSISNFAQTTNETDLFNAIKGNVFNTVKQLVEKGPNINATDSNRASMLMWAVYKSDLQMVQYLVSKGANAKNKGVIYLDKEKTGYYGSLVGLAAGEGKVDVLKFLMEDCKINIEDKEYDPETNMENGWTALQWAAYNGQLEVVKYLTEKGGNINANHTLDKGTPLFYASQNNQYDIARWLIEKGANVNISTNDGTTALMAATNNNNFQLCLLLWQNKATVSVKNNKGKTAKDIAVENGFSRMIDFLTTPGDYKNIQNRVYWKELNEQVIELFNKHEYEKATPVAEKAVELARKDSGENHTDYASSLSNLAVLYERMGESLKAIPLYIKTKDIREKVLGKDHPDYASSLSNLGISYESIGQYEKAEPLYVEAKEIRKKVLGEDDPDYATSLNNLGGLYESMNQYEKAELLYVEAKEIRKKILGEDDPGYATSLGNLAVLYKNMGQFEKAEPLYIGSLEIRKKLLGENHPDYATGLINLGLFYENISQYQKAESLYVQAKGILIKIWGENHPDYRVCLNNLADLYCNTGRYKKAEPLYVQTKEIQQRIFGEDDPRYALTLNNLAGLYLKIGQYQKAESLYVQAREIWKKALGQNHADYALCLQNLAELYRNMGQFQKAFSLCLQAKEIREKIFGKNHPAYASSLSSLAKLYETNGDYQKATDLFVEVREIRKRIFGEDHPAYATGLNNLAQLYVTTGHYEKAEPLFIQAKAITEKKLGKDHPSYATDLNNLAALYMEIGQYQKAEILFIQAIEIQQRIFGEEHPGYASSINNLAMLYQNISQYKKAESLFFNANEIWKRIFGEEHPDYISSLNNLAGLYQNMGQFKKAESLYVQTKEIEKRMFGEDHPGYALILNNLAVLYQELGQYKKAESLGMEAKEILKSTLGGHHPNYANSLTNLALLYISMIQYEKSESLLLAATSIEVQNLKNTFNILSENEKGNYLENNISLVDNNNSLLYNYRKKVPALQINNLNLQIFFKSLSLADTRSMLETIKNNKDGSVQQIFKEWQSNKSILAKQYSLPVNKRMQQLDSLEAKAETLEKELTRKSAEFSNQQKAISISMLDVQKNLEPNEAAIEFVRFNLYNKKWTDSVIYAAYILRKNDAAPLFIPLCEEKQLQYLFDGAGNTATSMVNNFYRGVEKLNKNAASLGKDLYKLVWAPLEPYLKGINKISYSPAGKLYSIAFHALPADSNLLLIDKYNLQQYASTRQVVLRTAANKSTKPGGIVLFGDATFSMDSVALVRQLISQPGKELVSTSVYAPQNRSSRDAVWNNLPGTAEEIKKIKALFDENKISTQLFIQTAATEENLKALSGNSPQILHIATHGFFLPEPNKKKREIKMDQDNTYTLADDPLLRSGLVLAGGNYAWAGKPSIDGVEDGIATAYEISQLNLGNTELVVLSACETALGDVKGSEGVFGLQRAFKMAGVKKMMVSLWQVPDKETAELMTTFYAYWMKGKTINDSFAAAQAGMRKKYSPFYWAAFVLVE